MINAARPEIGSPFALFGGARAREIRDLVDRLAVAATGWLREHNAIGMDFAEGAPGLALFLGYYGWLAGRAEYLAEARELLSRAAEADSLVMRRPSLYSGASG